MWIDAQPQCPWMSGKPGHVICLVAEADTAYMVIATGLHQMRRHVRHHGVAGDGPASLVTSRKDVALAAVKASIANVAGWCSIYGVVDWIRLPFVDASNV